MIQHHYLGREKFNSFWTTDQIVPPKNDRFGFSSFSSAHFESPIKSRQFSVFHSLLIIMSDQTDSWEQAT